MDSLILTQLSAIDVRKLLRTELEDFFNNRIKEEEEDQILSVKQVAELFHVTPAAVYSWVASKSVPFHKRGKKLYFFRAELICWIKESKEVTHG